MILKRFNIIFVALIILCSTSFYEILALGPLKSGGELMGVGLMVGGMLMYLFYSERRVARLNYAWPIALIILSAFTSMLMANYSWGQDFAQTLLAQRAIYFYLFYFLLHQMKVETRELEILFVVFGILHVIIYLVQFIMFPNIILDSFILEDRGTIRIYMPGGSYMAAIFWISAQKFFRTNKARYLLVLVAIFAIFVMNGGRQTIAVVTLLLVLLVFFDKRVKSRLVLIFLGLVGAGAIFLLFQNIFEALFLQSQKDVSLGGEYIRLKAARFYLTEFFKEPLAYITGNGAYYADSAYGKEIAYNQIFYRFFLSDIGLIGNYVIYGVFFVIGVLTICFRTLRIKIEDNLKYIKYMFGVIIIQILTGGAFIQADFIVFACCVMYMVDISRSNMDQLALSTE